MTGQSLLLGLLALGATRAAPEHFGALVAAHGDLRGASAAAFDGAGALWVCESGRDRLIKIGADGERRTIGARGSEAGRFLRPAGIATASDGRIFVADTGNDRVQVLDADGAPL